ncbi:hypothetical protein J7E29_09605 [Streptomyces sp. ISL-90]|nr:hypothetical protein [Streptomyces sp. ISL-90]
MNAPAMTPNAREGRLGKAKSFKEGAELMELVMTDGADLRDGYVTMCVLAGIAAADVICMKALGEYYAGQKHDEAVKLLEKVDKALAKNLAALLGMKTKAGYSDVPVSNEQITRARRAMEALVDRAAS